MTFTHFVTKLVVLEDLPSANFYLEPSCGKLMKLTDQFLINAKLMKDYKAKHLEPGPDPIKNSTLKINHSKGLSTNPG